MTEGCNREGRGELELGEPRSKRAVSKTESCIGN
jgi:hypothetical protein